MPATALALALAAAAVHAAWNLLLAGSADTEATGAVAIAVGAIVCLPALLVGGTVDAGVIPFVGASAALEFVYLVLLTYAYATASLTVVYPVARGSAPVLVLVAEGAILGLAPSALAIAGILLVAAGVMLIRYREPPPAKHLVLALAIGGLIASYTVVDKHGLAHASPLLYLEIVFGIVAVLQLAFVGTRRGVSVLRNALDARAVLAGIGFFGSYGLTLLALTKADAAPVAAVRESSVLLASAVAVAAGWERASASRVAGAAVVVAGIAAIAFG